MTELLCRWLNGEVQLSRVVEPRMFAKEFSTGYLIGEILYKHRLQKDFDQFSQGRNAVSQLNNFQRLFPTLQLLGVTFTDNVVKALIEEQCGVATRLLYQIYIALRRKEKAQLSKMALETMRSPAAAKLASISTEMYKQRLKSVIPRKVDVVLRSVSNCYEDKDEETELAVTLKDEHGVQKPPSIQEEQQAQNLATLRRAKWKSNELMGKIQASAIPLPKRASQEMAKATLKRKQELKKKEAEMFTSEIAKFAEILKKLTPAGGEEESRSTLQPLEGAAPRDEPGTLCVRVEEGKSFVDNVRRRLKEDAQARKEREKRRRRVMLEQLMAHEAQEEVYREEQLVNRLMRQSLQERRIAVQLMHARHEKHVMVQNRIFRERQYEEQRLKEFKESLDREEILARQEKLEQVEKIKLQREIHEQLMVEYAEQRFRKHYRMCQEVVEHILDLATKVAEYRRLTLSTIPGKVMREWKELFFNQMPIYEQAAAPQQSPTEVLQDDVELAKENMLNAQDYHNYQMMTGDWHPPDDGEIKGPPANNNVLGHVVGRIMEALCPSIQPSSPPVLPPFPIKACVMGKLLTGKTSCLEQLAEGLNIQAIHPDRLLREAVLAFNEGEVTSPTEDRAEEPSARAQLGERAAKFLRKGKSVPDELMVEIIVEYLRQLPVQCGWILDGFPVSSAQAKLLEKALTGVDPDKTLQTTKRYRTELVVDIKAPKEPSPPQPALDVAILLEVSDHTVLTRHFTSSASQGAESESQNPSSQQETKDVPGPIKRLPLSEEQLFPRLTGFLESWPELEKWFERQGILVKVNGELEQAELLERLEDVLVETLFKKHTGAPRPDSVPETWSQWLVSDAVTEKLSGVLTPGQVGAPPSPPPQDMAPKDGNLPGSGSLSGPTSAREPSDVSPNDKKQGLSGSLLQKDSVSRLSSAKGQSKKKPSTSPGDRKQSKSGVAKEKKGKSEAQLSEIASEPEDSQPPAPKPGSNQWVYVDEPVPQEVATYLARYWDSIVETYTGTIHRVMRELRSERDRVIQDLHAFRRDFQEYVETRPDHKQEFVSQWQDDYNSISDKLRADQDVQAELLLRLYSLRECLWDITDQRKEEAERERLRVMGSGWLQDHLGILLNLYTTLMQVEVDRFQDTSRFLQDYYKGMEGEIPLEDITGFARIPLVNVADVQLPSSTSQEQNSAPGSSQHGGQRELRISVPSSKGSEEQESEEEGGLEIRPCRVPLVPYRVPSSTLAVKDKGRSPGKVTGRTKEEVVADAPPINVDEYLIFEAYHTATSTLSNLIQREVKIREDEEKTLKEERENDQIKSSAGKDGKKKSAEKKGHRPTSPLQPTQVEDPQDVQRRNQRERMFTEYLGALEDEACAVTTRLELIKGKLLAAIQELKAKADAIFTAMEDSLGAQFLREMESIADLLAVGLEHVQAGAKMQYQLVLGSREFYINGDVKVTADPKPPPRPPTREVPKVGQLTVQQLCSLLQQFSLLSPTGIITRRAFIEALQDLVSHGLGSDQLPEPWCSVTYPQLLEMVQVLALDSDFLDWRQFLLSVAQPWPYPSLEQLLDTKKQFQDIDQAGSGFITQQEYDQVELWFTGDPEVKIPEEADEPLPFDRLRQLKQVFFSLFADGTQDPPQLDYNNMLLHFSSHQEPAQGLRRALSLCMGIPLAPVPAPSTYLQSEPCLTEGAAGMLVATGKDPASLSYEEKVPLSALFEIMNYGLIRGGDGHYQGSKDQGRRLLCKRFIQVYQELGSKQLEPVSFDVLLKHPVIVDVISNSTRFGQPDLQAIVQKRSVESERVASSSPEPSVELAPSTPH